MIVVSVAIENKLCKRKQEQSRAWHMPPTCEYVGQHIQDGCHSCHLGCLAGAIIQNNLPVKDSNHQKKFQVKWVNGSEVI